VRFYPGIFVVMLRKTKKKLSGWPLSQPRLELSTFRLQV